VASRSAYDQEIRISLPTRSGLLEDNAFRTLGLPADASSEEVNRREGSILRALDQGLYQPPEFCGVPAPAIPTKEDVLEAAFRLYRPESRMLEELFWLHEVDSLLDQTSSHVVAALRRLASAGTPEGMVARHNLAVLYGMHALQPADPRSFHHWKTVLEQWAALIEDETFWRFLESRAHAIGLRRLDRLPMERAIREELSGTLSTQIVHAIESGQSAAVAAMVGAAAEHRSRLDFSAAFKIVEQRHVRNGYISLGVLLERLSAISQPKEVDEIRAFLLEKERELLALEREYGDVVRCLGGITEATEWDDAVASLYYKMGEICISLTDDPGEATRLLAKSWQLAGNAQHRQSIEERQRQAIRAAQRREAEKAQRAQEAADNLRRETRRAAFCREAEELATQGKFPAADRKLSAAFELSNEEEKREIRKTRDRYRRMFEAGREDKGSDRTAKLCREAEALASFGDFAGAESKLMTALSRSSGEQRDEIQAMLGRFAWARVVWGIDTAKRNPTLHTFCGLGCGFRGQRDYDPETRSYITHHWLLLFHLPVFPLGAYRISDAGSQSYSVYGRVPLPRSIKAVRWAVALLAFAVVLSGAASISHLSARTRDRPSSVPGHVPLQALASARKKTPALAVTTPQSSRTAQLEQRRKKLEQEKADLERRRSHLARLAATYARSDLPGAQRAVYEMVLTEFKWSERKYEREYAAYQRDRRIAEDLPLTKDKAIEQDKTYLPQRQ
jgi:hypothetical protein